MRHAVCAVLSILLLPASAWPGPSGDDHWFCHALDCPEYTVVRRLDDDLELREYGEYLWVSTNVTDSNLENAQRQAFIQLYQYIQGDNEERWRIAMTAPVRTRIAMDNNRRDWEDTYTVSFYLPDEYQSGQRRPPAPSRDSLFIDDTPRHRYWVKSYPGFASESRVLETALDVMSRLDQCHEGYNAASFYTASYDPPFRIFYRHNELWIESQSGKHQTATAMQLGKTQAS